MIVRIRVLLQGRDSFHMIGQCERSLRIAVAAKCNGCMNGGIFETAAIWNLQQSSQRKPNPRDDPRFFSVFWLFYCTTIVAGYDTTQPKR